MKQVVITNGSGGCGKDEVAKIIQHQFKVYKYSAITKIKDIAAMCGWDDDKSDNGRKFLSDLKLASIQYNDLPMNDLRLIYNQFMSNTLTCSSNDKYCDLNSEYPSAEILIIDIREPLEIEKAAKEFNAITVLIVRPDVDEIKSNQSDSDVANYSYDYTIHNDGTLLDLGDKVRKFIEDKLISANLG